MNWSVSVTQSKKCQPRPKLFIPDKMPVQLLTTLPIARYTFAMSLPSNIRQMSVPERVRLAEEIWESIVEDGFEWTLSSAEEAEIDRRMAAIVADPSRARPWSEIQQRLLAKQAKQMP
jgi:putative addiction module component (TIGR02574 family)